MPAPAASHLMPTREPRRVAAPPVNGGDYSGNQKRTPVRTIAHSSSSTARNVLSPARGMATTISPPVPAKASISASTKLQGNSAKDHSNNNIKRYFYYQTFN